MFSRTFAYNTFMIRIDLCCQLLLLGTSLLLLPCKSFACSGGAQNTHAAFHSRTILSSRTLVVPTEFSDINEALGYLENKHIRHNAIVTINVHNTHSGHDYTKEILIKHPDADRIHIIGNVQDPKLCELRFTEGKNGFVSRGSRVGLISGFTVNLVDKHPGGHAVLAEGPGAYIRAVKIHAKNCWFGFAVKKQGYLSCTDCHVENGGDVGFWGFRGGGFSAMDCSVDTMDSGTGLGFGAFVEYGSEADCVNFTATKCLKAGLASGNNSALRLLNGVKSTGNLGDGLLLHSGGMASVNRSVNVKDNRGYGVHILDDQSHLRGYPGDVSGNVLGAAFRQSTVDRKNGIMNGAARVQQGANVSLSGSFQFGSVDRVAVRADETYGTVRAGIVTSVNNTSFGTTGSAVAVTNCTLSGGGRLEFRQRMIADDAVVWRNKEVVVSCLVYHDVSHEITGAISLHRANRLNNFSELSSILIGAETQVLLPGAATLVTARIADTGACENGLQISVLVNTGQIAAKNVWVYDLALQEGGIASSWVPEPFGVTKKRCEFFCKLLKTSTINQPFAQGIARNVTTIDFMIPLGGMFKTPTLEISPEPVFKIADGPALAWCFSLAPTSDADIAVLRALRLSNVEEHSAHILCSTIDDGFMRFRAEP